MASSWLPIKLIPRLENENFMAQSATDYHLRPSSSGKYHKSRAQTPLQQLFTTALVKHIAPGCNASNALGFRGKCLLDPVNRIMKPASCQVG